MKEFPYEKDTWHKLLDDRPGRIEGINTHHIRSSKIGIIASLNDIDSLEVQIMLTVAIKIISRWCSNIVIKLPDKISCQIKSIRRKSLREYLSDEIDSVDPYSNFRFVDEFEYETVDCALIVGNSTLNLDKNVIHINSTGWLAYYSFGSCNEKVVERKKDNPIGAIFSACIGVSAIYSYVLRKEITAFKRWYSVFDMSTSILAQNLPNPIFNTDTDIGRIYQVGCGAVGSSFIEYLSMTNWTGTIHLIDYDHIDIHNICSSQIFSADNAIKKIKKVQRCSEVLVNSGFNPIPYNSPGGYDDFIKEELNIKYSPDIILCLANEKNIWSTIQENYPPLVFHATTTSNWGINYGRHKPIEEWCIMCRFHKDIKHEYTPKCSNSLVDITPDGEEIHGVLPFLSPTSALMILAGIARLHVETDTFEKNSVNLSFRTHPLNYIVSSLKRPDIKCPVCSMQQSNIYPQEIVGSKYWDSGKNN